MEEKTKKGMMNLAVDLQGQIDQLKQDNETLHRQLEYALRLLPSGIVEVNNIHIYGGQNQIFPNAHQAEQAEEKLQ